MRCSPGHGGRNPAPDLRQQCFVGRHRLRADIDHRRAAGLGGPKNVGMRIDQARQEHTSGQIDLFRPEVPRQCALPSNDPTAEDFSGRHE